MGATKGVHGYNSCRPARFSSPACNRSEYRARSPFRPHCRSSAGPGKPTEFGGPALCGKQFLNREKKNADSGQGVEFPQLQRMQLKCKMGKILCESGSESDPTQIPGPQRRSKPRRGLGTPTMRSMNSVSWFSNRACRSSSEHFISNRGNDRDRDRGDDHTKRVLVARAAEKRVCVCRCCEAHG